MFIFLTLFHVNAEKGKHIDRESRNTCDTTITSQVKSDFSLLGRDDQCNRKNGKEATEEHEKLFIRPPSVQSLPTLSSSTTSNSSITSFVASNQTFTSSLSSSQRIQGDQSMYLISFSRFIIVLFNRYLQSYVHSRLNS